MPLINDQGLSPDHWRLAGADEDLGQVSHVIVPVERLDELLDGQRAGPVGMALANNVDLDLIAPHFDAIDLITVAFPSFADGRGFSLAKRIRALGYGGELWASGHLIPDQYAFARSCGFDAVLVDKAVFARQAEDDWRSAAAALSLSYQAGIEDWEQAPRSIMELRRLAREQLAAQ